MENKLPLLALLEHLRFLGHETKEVAKNVDTSPAYLSRMAHDKVPISIPLFKKIVRTYGKELEGEIISGGTIKDGNYYFEPDNVISFDLTQTQERIVTLEFRLEAMEKVNFGLMKLLSTILKDDRLSSINELIGQDYQDISKDFFEYVGGVVISSAQG